MSSGESDDEAIVAKKRARKRKRNPDYVHDASDVEDFVEVPKCAITTSATAAAPEIKKVIIHCE